MKKFVITESEKKEIREKQHKELKKILIKKLQEKYENPRILISEQTDWRDTAITGCKVFSRTTPKKARMVSDGKTVIKISADTPFVTAYVSNNGNDGKFVVGDVLFFFEDLTYVVYDPTNNWAVKGTYKWGCKAVEDLKKVKPYETNQLDSSSQEKEQMLTYYKNQGWREQKEVPPYELRQWVEEHVPDSERYWKDTGGIKLWKKRTGIEVGAAETSASEDVYSQNSEVSIKACIKTLDSYWRQFTKNLASSPTPNLRNAAQSCIEQHYGEDDWGGFLSNKDKKYDEIIETLTRQRAYYDNHRAPEEDSPWLLKPRSHFNKIKK
jgi:hypothetical protein